MDCKLEGFEWINADDKYRSIYSFHQDIPKVERRICLFVCNFTSRWNLTYEKKISINKGCRDGIYAGHGAGNMQIENLINKSTDTKNTDTKTINDMTTGMRVSDYIKTDSSYNMSKKAAVVGSSNSVDMSDTIYARPQAKNEAGNSDDTDMAEYLLNDMNQTSENRRNDMIVTASTTTSDDYKKLQRMTATMSLSLRPIR